MPTFTFLDNLEVFMRTGKLPENATKSARKMTRAASKNYVCKGGKLWRKYRGRLLRVIRSEEEMREVLARYHENNNHAGRVRMVKEIMLMYYWVGVTEAVKNWIHACDLCRSRAAAAEPPARQVLYCLVYGCEASSFLCPDLGFHKFPKDPALRRGWLALAQRDEGSLRINSYLCSRHFEPSCFAAGEDGRPRLSKDAVPTLLPAGAREDELPAPSDEDFLPSAALDDLLSSEAAAVTAAAGMEPSDLSPERPEAPAGLQEHRYSLPDSEDVEDVSVKRRKTVIEPTFTVYNHIARYLSHRVLPTHNKSSNGAFKRMAKRFGLIDGVLMYTRVTPPLRVPRSREEVNSILQQFHNNQGHSGQGVCQRQITRHFYWGSLTRDLARWISSCPACLSRTKRKWLRCSVSSCTNCCGPVERGLGLTFHAFPLHNTALLAQWLQAVGRPHWHPRLRSSVCSTHFTEDCFDRSGQTAALRPDAVPTLLVHGEAAIQPIQPAAGDEVFFAKYDAVELYLSKRTYPPGLSYVEKNTFRRFCKKFAVKDGELHVVRGERERLVLRNRPQVEAALSDYHNELNHLDANKCLRLLNERYFWKTMRPDVVQWISSCSQCSRKKGRKPQKRGGAPETPRTPPHDSDSSREEDEGPEDEGSEGGGSDGDAEEQPDVSRVVSVSRPGRVPLSQVGPPSSAPSSSSPVAPQPRIPILLRLTGPAPFRPRLPSGLRVTAVRTVAPQADAQTLRAEPPPAGRTEGGVPTAEAPPTKPPTGPASPNGVLKGRAPAQSGVQRPAKRKRDSETSDGAKKSGGGGGGGLEPVVARSTKPWPVFTIGCPTLAQPDKPPAENSSAVSRRSRRLHARAVIQQCSTAKVKVRPELDGAEAQWAEIQDGMVVYVCFFRGANEDVSFEMANSLMSTKLFRKDPRHTVSLLDRPGSVLLVPQDSLSSAPGPGRRLRPGAVCEPWWGAQLFSSLVAACRELQAGSARSAGAGVRVEHGVYGQRQELAVTSADPMTLLFDF